jgi:hypothetical protein
VIARQHGGASDLENLALACLHCNRHKGPNVGGVDPGARRFIRLYHPRRDRWDEHFGWEGAKLRGRNAIGRVTIQVLAINDPDVVSVRAQVILEGVFPDPE